MLTEEDCTHITVRRGGQSEVVCEPGSQNGLPGSTRPMTVTYALKWLKSKAQNRARQAFNRDAAGPAPTQRTRVHCRAGSIIENGQDANVCKPCPKCAQGKYREGCDTGWSKKGGEWEPWGRTGECVVCDKCKPFQMRVNCGTSAENEGADVIDPGECVSCSALCKAGQYPVDCERNKAKVNDPKRNGAVILRADGSAAKVPGLSTSSLGDGNVCSDCPTPVCDDDDKFPDYTKTCTVHTASLSNAPLPSHARSQLTRLLSHCPPGAALAVGYQPVGDGHEGERPPAKASCEGRLA